MANETELLQQAVSRLAILAADYDPRLTGVCDALRDALRSDDGARLKRAVRDLQSAVLSLGPPPTPVEPLRAFAQTLLEEAQALPPELHTLVTELAGDEAAWVEGAERLARACLDWVRRGAGADGDGTGEGAMRVCALLVAEILQQLLERVGLPGEFASRLERLYKRLDEGVQRGQWEGLLDEVAELAAEARLRLHRERSETHRFLRQMDKHLVEIDQRLSGRVRHNQAVWEEGEALHQAMRQEVEGLHAQLDLTEDTQRLRQLVRRRMESVFGHLERIRDLQGEQRDAEQAELNALRRRLAELEEETRQLRARLEEQRRKAMQDALTGIPNRLAFDERLHQEYARWKRFGEPLSLVVWDVDHFKRINDRLGHQAGDKVLKVIAKKLAEGIRETDFLARYGGEEFVMLMPGADLEGARKASDKLRERIHRTPFRFKGEPLEITLSAGIAQFHPGDDPRAVFERADDALYRAKRAGRNRCEVERLSGSNG